MSLSNNIKRDIAAARKIRLPWSVLLCIVIGSMAFYGLFDHFGKRELWLPTGISVLVLALVVYVKRNLSRRAWFWGTMAILAVLHMVLILSVPWTTKWIPAATSAAIGSVDLILILAILSVVGRFMEAPPIRNGQET